MGATNSTLNYQLSQFISTDKPAWLQDYNGDMEKIDAGINNAKVAADTAQNTANSAVSSIGTVSTDISALQTDVLAHTNDITDLQGDVNTIESLIGNGTPTAGDHTLIGAINTNTSNIDDLNTSLYHTLSITASTTVSDIENFITASITHGKIPHIVATVVDSNTTFQNCLMTLNNSGYVGTTQFAFIATTGSNLAFSIVVRATETTTTNTSFSNATLYY